MDKRAYFSEDRKYRYSLYRTWDPLKGSVLFIGLNPSTADETIDDPTIRRCLGFAQDWGYGGLIMGNLFAFRATYPKIMKSCTYPIGIDNNEWLEKLGQIAQITIAAWGNHGSFKNQDKKIISLIPDMYCLGTTKSGAPKHPLYLSKNTELIRFKEE